MVLLMMDVQTGIMNENLYAFERFQTNIKTLLDAARRYHIEVLYVRHDDGTGCMLSKGKKEFEIYEPFCPNKEDKVFDKMVNSAFKDSGLFEYLKTKDEHELILCGLQTDYCMDANVKCGFEHGFHVYVPAYSNTTIDNEFMSGKDSYHYYNDGMWAGRYADCVSVEDMLKIMKNS